MADNQKETAVSGKVNSVAASWTPMFTVTSNIYDVEPIWRELEKFGLQSPGQSFDFVRAWVEKLELPPQDQIYVTAYFNKKPFLVLPLTIKKRLGATILTWFVGDHVACNAPLFDVSIMSKLDETQRAEFWKALLHALPPSDAVYLPGLPTGKRVQFEAFEGLGKKPVCDYVYRTEFDSWDECEKSRRNRKRRRRDKQHRQKLDALGEVKLTNVTDPAEIQSVLKVMFEQKRRRFEQLGIEDPFGDQKVRDVYFDALANAKSIKPELLVLWLDDDVISVRYCIGHGDKLFALVSSMSDDEEIMVGSPGNQCILEILQSKLGEGSYKTIDIGVGESDEKRRWCNELQPVCNRFVPRTPLGWGFMVSQAGLERVKFLVKTNKLLFNFYKTIRGILPSILKT